MAHQRAKPSSELRPKLTPKQSVAAGSQVLPALPPPETGDASTHELWIRLSSFLSMRSPNTQVTYRGIIKEWLAFLGAEPGTPDGTRAVLKATDVHAIAYRNWLLERPGERPRMQSTANPTERLTTNALAPTTKQMASSARNFARHQTGLEHTQANATIAKKLSALRRVYRMLVGAGLLTRNPFDSDQVPPPSKDAGKKRPTEMVEFSLVKKLLNQPDQRTPKGLRDAAVLAALFGGALRRSEAAGLRLGDVHQTASGTTFLYLRATKAKRDAEQALPTFAAKTIWKLVRQREQEGAKPGDFLFISYTGRGGAVPTRSPLTSSGIYKLFCCYCSKAGVGDHVTPHSARATAITKLLADGIPHREVKDFSRHSSIQMVEVYDKRRKSVDQNPAKMLDFDE